MQIVSGKFKGKILTEFSLESTRPTSALVRGAIFNIIGAKIEGSVFVDLFAGTGAVGIEALSRGASRVFFVDDNFKSVEIIKKNLAKVEAENYQVLNLDYAFALKNLAKNMIKADIFFIDPPYASNFGLEAIKKICDLNLLSDDGMIFWEHDASSLKEIKIFKNTKTKKYGKKFVTIIKNQKGIFNEG